jgi:hypothetical protein
MKDVMAKRGFLDADGVPKFEYMPRSEGHQLQFDLDRPLHQLPADLLTKFKGQTIRVESLILRHTIGTPFLERNYKQVLIELEQRAEISCDPPAERRRPRTMGDDVFVTFPA